MARYKVVNVKDVNWIELPGHARLLAKKIYGPKGVHNVQEPIVDFGASYYEPGAHVDETVHEKTHHIFFVTSGEITYYLDGDKIIAREGDALYIPAGVRHAADNNTDKSAQIIALLWPPLT